MDDMQLLQEYAQSGNQEAFERLVTRHIDWVYSVCLRGVKDRHLAEDVTQAVFIILARKAKSLPPNTILRGWLFKAARLWSAFTPSRTKGLSFRAVTRVRSCGTSPMHGPHQPAQVVDQFLGPLDRSRR